MKSLEWLWEQCPLMVQKIQSLYLFLPLKNNKTVINVNIFKKALIKNLVYSFWSEKWEKIKKLQGRRKRAHLNQCGGNQQCSHSCAHVIVYAIGRTRRESRIGLISVPLEFWERKLWSQNPVCSSKEVELVWEQLQEWQEPVFCPQVEFQSNEGSYVKNLRILLDYRKQKKKYIIKF